MIISSSKLRSSNGKIQGPTAVLSEVRSLSEGPMKNQEAPIKVSDTPSQGPAPKIPMTKIDADTELSLLIVLYSAVNIACNRIWVC